MLTEWVVRVWDAMFNSIVNGATTGSLEAAITFAMGDGPEEAGQAFGGGFVMGGSAFMNQPGQKGGKSIMDDEASTIRFMETKLVENQLNAFRKLTPEARYVFIP